MTLGSARSAANPDTDGRRADAPLSSRRPGRRSGWTTAALVRSRPAGPVTGPIVGFGGLCVDVRSASRADRTAVQVYGCNGSDAQSWTVQTNGTVQALGKCLDVSDGATADGTPVQLYACNGTGAQVWRAQPDGTLLNPRSGRCLDDAGSGPPGTQLIIFHSDVIVEQARLAAEERTIRGSAGTVGAWTSSSSADMARSRRGCCGC